MSIAELSEICKEQRITMGLYTEELGEWRFAEEDKDFDVFFPDSHEISNSQFPRLFQ